MDDIEKNARAKVEIAKSDDDKRLVFGWASIAVENGEQLEDIQHDVIDPEDLEEAAYEYVLNFRDTGEEHLPSMRKKGKLVESCVFTEEKQKAMGLEPDTLPVGWWIGFYIEDDDAWERIKDGTYQMFSIEGRAERVPVGGVQKGKYGGCGVIVMRDGKVLAGTRIESRGKGRMCGPGGNVKAGESKEEAAIREANEEFGVQCRELKHLGRVDNGTSDVFLCVDFTGEPKADEVEMTEARWVDPKEITQDEAYPPFFESLALLEKGDDRGVSNGDFEYIDEVEKFNPYHGPDGRFTSAGNASSVTFRPGASRAHDNAIERERIKQNHYYGKDRAEVEDAWNALNTRVNSISAQHSLRSGSLFENGEYKDIERRLKDAEDMLAYMDKYGANNAAKDKHLSERKKKPLSEYDVLNEIYDRGRPSKRLINDIEAEEYKDTLRRARYMANNYKREGKKKQKPESAQLGLFDTAKKVPRQRLEKGNKWHDPKTGRFTFAPGGKGVTSNKKSGKIKKVDTSRKPTLHFSKDEYAMLISELNTHMTTEERKKKVVTKTIGLYTYTFENNGFGEYRFIDKQSAEED